LPGKNAAPYFCPFCAEEDLHPLEQPGLWACRACLRTFSVTLFAGRS
jgi:ribosomal protein L37AE/L43A